MPDQDELPFSVALSERVKQDDGRYSVPYQTIKKNNKTIAFALEPSTFSTINEARRSVVDQVKKQVAAGLTGDLDDAIDVAL